MFDLKSKILAGFLVVITMVPMAFAQNEDFAETAELSEPLERAQPPRGGFMPPRSVTEQAAKDLNSSNYPAPPPLDNENRGFVPLGDNPSFGQSEGKVKFRIVEGEYWFRGMKRRRR